MIITFLIGNGFDLNLGLNTQYCDFLKVYKNSDSADSDVIAYFKETVLKEKELWSNAEEAFGIVTEKFKTDGYNAEEYCECHEDFCNNLAAYLLKEEQRINYTEAEKELAKNMAVGILSYKKSFRENERNAIEAVEGSIGNSLVFNFINFNYTQTLDLCVEALKKNSSLLGRRSYLGASYNNTVGTIMHVHGTVHRDMVLGVNDLSQISECSIFDGVGDEYVSQIIKQKTNEINGENVDRKVYDLLKKSDFIYIYGMSTGITDKLWWERIGKLMKENKKLHLFIHKYNAPQDGLIRRRTISYEKKERRDFIAYSGYEEEIKEDIEQRIHIDKSNIFDGLKDIAVIKKK